MISLSVASGLFAADETEMLDKMLADYFGGNTDEGDACVIDEEDEPLGVAYYSPAPAADRTWYLTMIAVRPDRQDRGRGTALLRRVEDALRADNQRVLLVVTPGLLVAAHPGFLGGGRRSGRVSQVPRRGLDRGQDSPHPGP